MEQAAKRENMAQQEVDDLVGLLERGVTLNWGGKP